MCRHRHRVFRAPIDAKLVDTHSKVHCNIPIGYKAVICHSKSCTTTVVGHSVGCAEVNGECLDVDSADAGRFLGESRSGSIREVRDESEMQIGR